MKSYYGSFCGKELFLNEETLEMSYFTNEEVEADSKLSSIRESRPYSDEEDAILKHGERVISFEDVVIGYDDNSILNVWSKGTLYQIGIMEVASDVVRLTCDDVIVVQNLSVHTPMHHLVPFILDEVLYLCVDDTYIRFGEQEIRFICPYEQNVLTRVKCGRSMSRDEALSMLA